LIPWVAPEAFGLAEFGVIGRGGDHCSTNIKASISDTTQVFLSRSKPARLGLRQGRSALALLIDKKAISVQD
jgi:hypothetical protein